MDPSLSNWGFVSGKFNLSTNKLSISTIHTIETRPTKLKTVRKNHDDLYRAESIATALLSLPEHQVMFIEVPVGSQSARAMASYGICVGILAYLRASGTPFIQVNPLDIKLATLNSKTASKQAIVDYQVAKHPKLDWKITRKKSTGKKQISVAKNEHIADAISAIDAGVLTEQFKQLIALRA